MQNKPVTSEEFKAQHDISLAEYVQALCNLTALETNTFIRRAIIWAVEAGILKFSGYYTEDALALGKSYDEICARYHAFLQREMLEKHPFLAKMTIAPKGHMHYQEGFTTIIDADGDLVAQFELFAVAEAFLLLVAASSDTDFTQPVC